MAIKKSELYSSLWASCDALRGGMDASQYKDYVLTLLFVKYVSDKYAGQKDPMIAIPKSGSFEEMVALRGKKDIGEGIDKIISKLAEANGLQGVIDQASFNNEGKLGSGKDMVDRLSNLVSIFAKLSFGRNRIEDDDLLGDAYEYLMRNFAEQSGKSKGQFYTPAEVSRIMAQVIGIGAAKSASETIYDPTCGSGSLLLKAHHEAQSNTGKDLAIYGQENDVATAALAKMNMFLHDCPTAEIWRGNTLSAPHHKDNGRLKQFDFVVANPPFSHKAWSSGLDPENDEHKRFEMGIPPAKNGDYAFLSHLIASMKSKGKGAIILPHGVLFRGNVEASIRKRIIKQGYIKGIIGLPANLFFGTGIPACILVLDKEHAGARKGIFMINASKGFMKDGNKNRLRSQDIHRIVDTFTRQIELPKYSRMVPHSEISDPKNDFNLNIPRYIDSSEPEDLQDIEAHLKGGIPNRDIDDLTEYWEVFPSLKAELFKPNHRKDYSDPKIPSEEVKPAVLNHDEFAAFDKSITTRFNKWIKKHRAELEGINTGDRPKALIDVLSESLLESFRKAKLIDPYDVYQHLMDYWHEVMQDDVYQIVQEGWKGTSQLRQITDPKSKEKADFVIAKKKFKADYIPPELIVDRFFAKDAKQIEELEQQQAALAAEMEELAEEHSGEEGLLEEAKNDKGNLTKGSVKERLAEVKDDPVSKDELKVLKQYLKLIDKESKVKKEIKDVQTALETKVIEQYKKLTVDEIKTLIVEDKWLAKLSADIQSEIDRVSQSLAGRVKELTERYAEPLPALSKEVDALTTKVEKHLQKMGFSWK